MTRRILNALLGLASICLCLCAGCWNRVDVEDSRGNSDRLILPSGYHLVKPLLVKQNDSNMVVTITFERNEK
jgi:hypothetical protein